MSAGTVTKQRHRCDGCRRVPADFQVEERRTRPGSTDETKGLKAPWETRFLCEPCCKQAALADDPPRKVVALPHYQPPAATASTEQLRNGTFSDEWGRRP